MELRAWPLGKLLSSGLGINRQATSGRSRLTMRLVDRLIPNPKSDASNRMSAARHRPASQKRIIAAAMIPNTVGISPRSEQNLITALPADEWWFSNQNSNPWSAACRCSMRKHPKLMRLVARSL
jgi:hypothetical protein